MDAVPNVPDIDDPVLKAEAIKTEANRYFESCLFNKAIELYTRAIELNPSAVYYSNRSFAYLKMECFGSALVDADKSIELDNKYIKGYYRRAAAYMGLRKFKMALKDYGTVCKVSPNNEQVNLKYNECLKLMNKLAFESAISVSYETKSIADSIDIDSMVVDDTYKGPELKDGKVTKDFVMDLMETYKKQGKLHRKYAYKILLDVKDVLKSLPSLVDVHIDDDQIFTVCGDIHGQFYDLMNIFELNGQPSETNQYLFNGDFVDRGSFSVECIFTLFCFKLLYPDTFFLGRGNHESQAMNQMYGFTGEVTHKYSAEMYELFLEVFNWLPLAHCLNKRVLVMHGGLFNQEGVTLDQIREINRNRQPPDEGLMCDLLWSDPQPIFGRSPSKRGIGIQFGPDITEKFIQLNKLDYIIRSHEVKPDGYEIDHSGKCITVFSAPNYCDCMGNKGAYILLKGKDMRPKYRTFEAVSHPSIRPMAYASRLFNIMGDN